MRKYLFILDEFKSPIPHELYLRIQSNAIIIRMHTHVFIWRGVKCQMTREMTREIKYCPYLQKGRKRSSSRLQTGQSNFVSWKYSKRNHYDIDL